ncbi:hypothetical protein ACIRYZ_36690 [Kitasatospora sp. NPDC101155]
MTWPLTAPQLAQLGACYGYSMEEIAEYAHASHLVPVLHSGFHSYLGDRV